MSTERILTSKFFGPDGSDFWEPRDPIIEVPYAAFLYFTGGGSGGDVVKLPLAPLWQIDASRERLRA
jgi:hypothetical protein